MPSSIEERCQEWEVSPVLRENLKAMGFTEFFSIQEDVIPVLIRQNSNPRVIPRDIYVSSPTGSGKTLSYALPVADYFLKSGYVNSHRLRCLILLPNRELAQQVYSFFSAILKGTGVNVSMTIGNGDSEEEKLANAETDNVFRDPIDDDLTDDAPILSTDILISTSGRLLDNLLLVPGFSLQYLRFLILDEADRLLSNAYHGWVRTLLSSVENLRLSYGGTQLKKRRYGELIDDNLPLQRLLFSATATDDPQALSLLGIHSPLFIYNRLTSQSSGNPLEDTELFTLPSTLAERRMTVTTENKLFKLVCLLIAAFNPKRGMENLGKQQLELDYFESCKGEGSVCIIFVASVDASHRLSTVLKLLNNQLVDNDVKKSFQSIFAKGLGRNQMFPGRVEEMTSLIRPADREKIVSDALAGHVSIIVSSDRMARGMDLPNVKLVVNYEVPKQAKTYVHRSGRTARAGRSGHCLTLVKEGQYNEFQRVSREIRRQSPFEGSTTPAQEDVKKMIAYRIPDSIEETVRPLYDVAVSKLSGHLEDV